MKSRQSDSKTDITRSRGSLSPGRGEGSRSPPRLRTWDPLVGEEEKSRRKALREEALNSSPLTRHQDPVLLIKKKEIITSILPGDVMTDEEIEDAPKYIKKTANPRHVNIDYSEAKERAREQNDPKKIKTKVLDKRPQFKLTEKDEVTEEKVTKITGTEFLPRGYVELEPMLLLNEFEFVSHHYEEAFIEDQRKTKELRRKQYGQRNMNRVRDFVIYRIEYIKTEAAKILRKWFDAKDQPMPYETICHFAEMLGLEPHTFQKLHDAYMKERNLQAGKHIKNLNEAIFNDQNQEELRNQEIEDEDSRSSSPNKVPIDPARRAEILAEQKRARQDEARRRQQNAAANTYQQSLLANNLAQAQADAESQRLRAEKLKDQQSKHQQQLEKLAREKELREQDMMRARREHSKEKDARTKLAGTHNVTKQKLHDTEQDLADLKAKTSNCMEEKQRLQKLVDDQRIAHEKALKDAVANARKDADKLKREGLIEAEVDKERAKHEIEDLKSELEAAHKRIAELEAEVYRLQRALSKSRERKRKELEKERAAEKELEAQRQAMIAAQRASKLHEQARREDEERFAREADILRLEAIQREDAERRREDAKRLDDIKRETEKLRREREKLEKERERLAEEERARLARRQQEELEKQRLAHEREQRRKAKEEEKKKREAELLKFTEDKKATRPYPAGYKKPEEPIEEDLDDEIDEEEELEDDSRDAVTLATLDYDIRNLAGRKLHDDDAEAYRSLIEDLISKMKIPHGLTYDDLWAMFLDYCRHDLPDERGYQKKMMAMTFQRFLKRRFAKASGQARGDHTNTKSSPKKISQAK